jgi:hypothetical protein
MYESLKAEEFETIPNWSQNSFHCQVGPREPHVLNPRRSLAATCKQFVECPDLLISPDKVLSRASEAHFHVFLVAVEGATTEIEMENVIDLESLIKEFQFVEVGGGLGNSFRSSLTSRPSGLSRGLPTCRHSWRSSISGVIGGSAWCRI